MKRMAKLRGPKVSTRSPIVFLRSLWNHSSSWTLTFCPSPCSSPPIRSIIWARSQVPMWCDAGTGAYARAGPPRPGGHRMANPVPIVDYLVLDGPGEGGVPHYKAHLVANQCVGCGARYFDRRNSCANADCGGTEFTKVAVATAGEVKAFTIVAFAAPGIPVPFVAAL